jgi:diketogulonate reductase-like aldo/keto reductase
MIPCDTFPIGPEGTPIPARGLGTFQHDPNLYLPGSVKESVLAALKAGYRHLDTSPRYDDGKCEVAVGEAIRESGIPRGEIFVVTKL